MRKRFLLAISVLLVIMMALPGWTQAKGKPVPDPVPVGGAGGGTISIMGTSSPAGTPGTWYVGATPPNVDYTKPVLLFVHGKGGSAQVWWGATTYHGTNDMYTYAYNNGYRTAFVDLYPDKNMWDNGSMLKGLTDRITAYFGVSKVTIIAHSKGGVDTNSASVHYGAAPKIRRVVTLGSPHWGTPLADYAYSTWTWWLAELMGERNDATYVMQTGYMKYFRSITDGKDPVPYYTLSGYKCGPVFSAMWYSCAFISGEDDGVVPVWSARIPGGTHLKEGYWDHDEIRMGSRTWSTFSPYIRTARTEQAVAVADLLAAAAAPAAGRVPDAVGGRAAGDSGSVILRGGEVTGTVAGTPFPLESGVRSATFTFYASSPAFTATLTGPDGAAYSVAMAGQVPADQVFGGAWVGAVTVSAPAAGQWQLATAAPERAGYLMAAGLESDLQATLDTGGDVATPGGSRPLAYRFSGARLPQVSQAEAAVAFAGGQAHTRAAFAAGRAVVAVPAGSGVHNVTVSVTGRLDDGTAFERSLVSSFAAVAPGDRGGWR